MEKEKKDGKKEKRKDRRKYGSNRLFSCGGPDDRKVPSFHKIFHWACTSFYPNSLIKHKNKIKN